MTSTHEVQVIKREISRTEKWLASANANLAYATAVDDELMLESASKEVWRARTRLNGWHGAFKLLTGEDYDAG